MNKYNNIFVYIFIVLLIGFIFALIGTINSSNYHYKVETIKGEVFDNCKENHLIGFECGNKQIFNENVYTFEKIKNENSNK